VWHTCSGQPILHPAARAAQAAGTLPDRPSGGATFAAILGPDFDGAMPVQAALDGAELVSVRKLVRKSHLLAVAVASPVRWVYYCSP
jgi:hypothetical protein